MTEHDSEFNAAIWWFWGAVFLSLFIGMLNVIDSFYALSMYMAYLSESINTDLYPEWYQLFKEIETAPYTFLLLNLYTMVIWSGVTLSALWLLRWNQWAYKSLRFLLSFDIIFTVVYLVYKAWTGSLTIGDRGLFILINVLQIVAILILSHPDVNALVSQKSTQHKNKPSQP